MNRTETIRCDICRALMLEPAVSRSLALVRRLTEGMVNPVTTEASGVILDADDVCGDCHAIMVTHTIAALAACKEKLDLEIVTHPDSGITTQEDSNGH